MKISRIISSLTVGGLLCITASSTASASSVTAKPSKPTISGITAVKSSRSGKVDVTVVFTKAATNSKAPLTLTEVKIGSATCKALKSATRCTVKNISVGKKVKVSARAMNRNGFGGSSFAVSYIPKAGNKWVRSTPASVSTTVPGVVSTTVPGVVSTTVPGVVSTTVPSVVAAGLKFNIKNAVGLALKSSVSSAAVRKNATGSNLQTVDSAGNTADAVSSGSASIAKFLIAPNDKLFVLFNNKTAVGETSCLLAEVNKTTGEPACIESELISITWPSEANGSNPIQFSSDGALYYMGQGGVAPNDSGVLRRYSDGKTTSLVTNNVLLSKFLVLNSGDVLLEGSTKGTGATWLRKVSITGELSTILTPFTSYLMLETSDRNVLLHSYFNGSWGYKRYITNESRIESDFWIVSQAGGSPTSRFNLRDVCLEGQLFKDDAFCSGAGITRLVIRTLSQKVLLLQTYNGKNSSITQVNPTFIGLTSEVKSVGVAQSVLDYIILSGTNGSSKNVTTLYNSSTDTEQVLIPAATEIEVYHLNYVASTNKIMFDGLRFSDNKYVIGQVDLNTRTVTASQTGSSKLLDFQTFGS